MKGKKRQINDEDQSRDPKHPRIVVDDSSDSIMDIDDATTDVGSLQSLSPYPSPSTSCPSPSYNARFCQNVSQDESNESNALDRMVDNMDLGLQVCDNTLHITGQVLTVTSTVLKGVSNIASNFEVFAPFISTFLNIGSEIISLYNKAEHHKELCSFLLKRCKFATAAVEDLNIRRAENAAFFSKGENLTLFMEFVDCMKRIRTFIAEVSQLKRLNKYLHANSTEEKFTRLINEFEAYMTSLSFSFTIQSKDELTIIKNEIKQIREILSCYGVPEDEKSQQDFFDGMNLITEKNKNFIRQNRQNKPLDSSEHKILDEIEPLLDGNQYHKTGICPSKRIEKRTYLKSCDEFCYKEFPNNPPSLTEPSNSDETQVEIRKQINILKELKNSDHIIRFYGVSYEDSKFYLVTEWMEHGNLHEYYTEFRDDITWKTKIKFALDICRGVAYLHECRILHRDIQSANILVNRDHKVRIANFGLSRKFSDLTRNISHNLENIRYMAPEKLDKEKKKSYDSKCEIYSVGALLWEIAELKKPHDDLKSEAIIKIRKRIEEKYSLPFSEDVPYEWRFTVTKAMEHEPMWRHNISDICRDFYNLSKKYFDTPYKDVGEDEIVEESKKVSMITILSVEDAIREHKSNNGDKQLAWQSFKYHSSTNIEAKYWLGYYYFHEEIIELKTVSREEKVKTAASIFKETADKGNPSAQLRYGMCLWKGEGVETDHFEALKYFEMAANLGNAAAMYAIGKAYWSGVNGIEQDKTRGAKYLKNAASRGHDKAKDMCITNNIL